MFATLDDVSLNWFFAQAVLCVAGFVLGRAVGRTLPALADITILLVVALSIVWALRERALDTFAAAAPLWALVYVESTGIVPPFMFMTGVLAGRATEARTRRLGHYAAAFGLIYFLFNAAWMISPRVDDSIPARFAAAGPVVQSRSDTCVPAAIATALRSPGVGLQVSEAEMARDVDVRAGRGATMLRALYGLQRRLAGASIEPRLITASPDTLAAIASDDRPVLVTLRSGRAMTHMVVLYGRAGAGAVRIFNPAVEGDPFAGMRFMSVEEFRRRATGNGIALIPRGAIPG